MGQNDSTMLESASKPKSCAPVAIMCPDVQGTASMETLVGSQKRKARKTKITHLVRTADGSVSPAEGKRWIFKYLDLSLSHVWGSKVLSLIVKIYRGVEHFQYS